MERFVCVSVIDCFCFLTLEKIFDFMLGFEVSTQFISIRQPEDFCVKHDFCDHFPNPRKELQEALYLKHYSSQNLQL
jgi:hypothetical protein